MTATPEVWWGRITATIPTDPSDRLLGGSFVVADPRWPHLPPVGTLVEVRSVYRSPYWSLVEED